MGTMRLPQRISSSTGLLIICFLAATRGFSPVRIGNTQPHNICKTITNPSFVLISTSSSRRKTTTTALSVIFTKLSEDCQTALAVAQEQALISGQSEIDETYMLLGIVDTPGKTKPTLDKYDISWSNVRRTLNSYAGGPSVRKPIRLADFKENKKMLPYSKTLQERLFHAGTISAAMGGTAIETEHVLLSLLRYQEVDGQVYAATRGDDSEAMEIIYNLDATLDGEDICNDLLQSLMETRDQPQSSSTPLSPGSSVDKEIAQLFKDGKVAADKKTNSSSLLDEFGIDLTRQARDGELEIVYGREEEIQNCLRVLLRRKKNNVCLIGDAGTGKSSVGEGLAQVLVSDECPALLKGYRMISLEVASLLSGTKFRGAFEERFRGILEEIASGEGSRTILFLDEMHTLMGSGSTEGSQLSPANLLKPYLAKGKIKVVGATTIVEYRSITKDAAMDRRFQPVLVREPSVNQTVDILNALLPFYSAHHRVEYDRESLVAAARLSDRYITDRFLPDKAIDLIDEAGALATLRRIPNEPAPVVDEELITEIVSDWSSIPVGALKMDETERLEALEANMGRRVIGQERAVKAVAKAIRRSRTGIRNPSRPIASFLFCGPTGTGKTELCKTLAAQYYGSERNMIRIDMSEYSEKFTVSRLTGPPPGFVGYEEGGLLTEAVRRNPHSVILLDELEKAHPDVLNILLQVIDDGILTDGRGQTISFKNSVIIMTSNIGSKRVLDLAKSKDGKNDDGRPLYSKLAAVVKGELEAFMKPEFLNRIDDIVVFQPLTGNELYRIASMMSRNIILRTKLERDLDIIVTSALLQKVVNQGSKAASQFGARPMRRSIQYILEDAISDAILKGFLRSGDVGTFDLQSTTDDEDDDDDEFNEDGMRSFHVVVSRSRDTEKLSVEIEESCRDIQSERIDDQDDDKTEKHNGLLDVTNGESKTLPQKATPSR